MMITAESLFAAANFMAMIAWGMLIMLPRWRGTKLLVRSGALPIALAAGYTLLIAVNIGEGDGGFGSLEQVNRLFQHPYLLLAGWVHYLVFDLLIGIWEVNDAEQCAITHLAITPALLLTFFFGPMGWLLYLVIKGITGAQQKRASI